MGDGAEAGLQKAAERYSAAGMEEAATAEAVAFVLSQLDWNDVDRWCALRGTHRDCGR